MLLLLTGRKIFIVSDENENIVETPAKGINYRKPVSTPVKTPGNEVNAQTEGRRGAKLKV